MLARLDYNQFRNNLTIKRFARHYQFTERDVVIIFTKYLLNCLDVVFVYAVQSFKQLQLATPYNYQDKTLTHVDNTSSWN